MSDAPEPQAVCGFMPDDLAQVMSDLLPQGWVWPRDPRSVQQRTLAGMAMEYSRLYVRDCDLLAEADPCNALETLSDWERVLGLPDPCTGPLETLQQRRAAVCAKIALFGDTTLESMQDYMRRRGVDAELEAGPGRFDFTVWTPEVNPVWFRAGQSTAGERIRIWGNQMLECGIEYIKPAHTRPVIAYLVPAEWDSGQSVWDNGDTLFDLGVKPPS